MLDIYSNTDPMLTIGYQTNSLGLFPPSKPSGVMAAPRKRPNVLLLFTHNRRTVPINRRVGTKHDVHHHSAAPVVTAPLTLAPATREAIARTQHAPRTGSHTATPTAERTPSGSPDGRTRTLPSTPGYRPLRSIARPGLSARGNLYSLETTFPRIHCGAGPIATPHRRGFVRLRHLPAPGDEFAGTDEKAHLGRRGGARSRWHSDPRRRQVRGSGVSRALRGPCESGRRGRAGLGPGGNRSVSPQHRSAPSRAPDYISHRPPRRTPDRRSLSASQLITRGIRPLRWVWRGPHPLKLLAGVLH